MKKIYLIILATVAFVQLSVAQNNVPATGPVSFGTTSTSSLLNIGSSTTRGTMSITGSTTAAPVLSLTDSHSGGRGYSLYSGLSALGSFEIFDQTASAYRFVINSSAILGLGQQARWLIYMLWITSARHQALQLQPPLPQTAHLF
jgi:hypothetical protein